MSNNLLFYGDNLDVLRRHIEGESVDLVYLDPPFNSNANYNVLFAERDGRQAAAQIKAFEDTWRWDDEAARSFEEVVERGGLVSQAIKRSVHFSTKPDCSRILAIDGTLSVDFRTATRSTTSSNERAASSSQRHVSSKALI